MEIIKHKISKEESMKMMMPKYKATLIIVEGFGINTFNKYPNIWIRFWQKLFFGFKWKKL